MFSGIRSWFERSAKRDQELAEGADADLMQANRRRYKIAFGLFAFAALVAFVERHIHLPASLRTVLGGAAAACGIIGIVLGQWAMREHQFLTKPDPERPPTIFDDKD